MKRELPRLERSLRGLDDLAGSRVPNSQFADPVRAREEAEADRDSGGRSGPPGATSATDRRLLLAYVVEHRRMPAIAAHVGCFPEAAHRRAQRALAKLRALMHVMPARPPARLPRRRG